MDTGTPKDTGLHSLGRNEPLGDCPGCTKPVYERDVHFRTTTSNDVWHGKCAEGVLDCSGVMIRVINLYATAVLGSLEYINVGRIAPAVKGLEEVTTAVNDLFQRYGVAHKFPTPKRPVLGVAPTPRKPPEEGPEDDSA